MCVFVGSLVRLLVQFCYHLEPLYNIFCWYVKWHTKIFFYSYCCFRVKNPRSKQLNKYKKRVFTWIYINIPTNYIHILKYFLCVCREATNQTKYTRAPLLQLANELQQDISSKERNNNFKDDHLSKNWKAFICASVCVCVYVWPKVKLDDNDDFPFDAAASAFFYLPWIIMRFFHSSSTYNQFILVFS